VELRKIKPTAQAEYETAAGKLQFTVAYVPRDQAVLDYQELKPSERIKAILAEVIIGWNLVHDDGTPWPCDEETKGLLLPQLVLLPVKQEPGPDGKVIVPAGVMLGLALYAFITEERNFLKN
jgi:hypothetical protein